MNSRYMIIFCLFFLFVTNLSAESSEVKDNQAKDLVTKAVEHWRGKSSYMVAKMLVWRPDHERTLEFSAKTRGREESIVKFTAPAKDAGNATLMKKEDVWSYSTKTNRIIKIPPSMKGQSWMGSDFSYQDLAKDAEIIYQYDHKIIVRPNESNANTTTVESIPLDSAPVPWGKEELDIRSDLVISSHRYYDQDMKLIKTLKATKIDFIGGRIYPVTARMTNEETKSWTEIDYLKAEFDTQFGENEFTTTALQKD